MSKFYQPFRFTESDAVTLRYGSGPDNMNGTHNFGRSSLDTLMCFVTLGVLDDVPTQVCSSDVPAFTLRSSDDTSEVLSFLYAVQAQRRKTTDKLEAISSTS